MNREISVVVPVYNSEASLPELVERVRAVMSKLAGRYELILVNDGSRDRSWDVIASLSRVNPWVRGFDLARNFGQHNALVCGIRAARYETIATIDDDLQHPPEVIEVLLRKLDEGYDVVYGTPREEQHGLFRDFASVMTKVALKSAMGIDIARHVSAFRVFRTRIRDAFETYRSPFVSVDVLLTWGAARFAAVPVEHQTRRYGASNYTLRKLVVHALNMLTGFSTWPLRFASIVGFAFTFGGILMLAYVLTAYLIEGRVVPGFAFLASTIAIFSGAQLFAIGVIGEYLARMHFRSMEKPIYVLREKT